MLSSLGPLLFAALLTGSTSSPEPIAVAPWRNLNADQKLTWLEQGAAETMAADLKKGGLKVVERAQIAAALKEVSSQHNNDEVASAVAAGRIVGARSIVLGSFQTNGGAIRLVARVVDVETGAVGKAAKATGPLRDIFRLQDSVVAGLLPQATKSRSRRRRKTPANIPAYEKLAASLTAPDPASQQALLEAALQLDPNFVYAREALNDLEARLRARVVESAPLLRAREAELLAVAGDVSAPTPRRQQAAVAVLTLLRDARRYGALLQTSEAVLALKLPSDIVDDVNDRASAARVVALARLMRGDLALQAGEAHLAAFPAGSHRAEVDVELRKIVERKRSEADRRAEFAKELAELAAEKSALGHSPDPDTAVEWAFSPCIAAKWSTLADEMISHCERFLAFPAEGASDRDEHIRSARAYVAWGWALKGDFLKAQRLAAELEAADPGALDDSGLRSVQAVWSVDAFPAPR